MRLSRNRQCYKQNSAKTDIIDRLIRQNYRKDCFFKEYLDSVSRKAASPIHGKGGKNEIEALNRTMLESIRMTSMSTHGSRNNHSNLSRTNVTPMAMKSVRRNLKREKAIASIYTPTASFLAVNHSISI